MLDFALCKLCLAARSIDLTLPLRGIDLRAANPLYLQQCFNKRNGVRDLGDATPRKVQNSVNLVNRLVSSMKRRRRPISHVA